MEVTVFNKIVCIDCGVDSPLLNTDKGSLCQTCIDKFNAKNIDLKKMFEDLLTTAFEGGSNYWYMIETHNRKYVPACEFLSQLLCFEIGEMTITHEMCKEGKKVTHQDVINAWKKFSTEKEYVEHYADAISGNFDADTCDVFLQIVVIGKVIYG